MRRRNWIGDCLEAAQLGKKVILLEKGGRVGGNTDIAHGFFPVYSKLHAEQGIEDVTVRVMVERADGVIGENIWCVLLLRLLRVF